MAFGFYWPDEKIKKERKRGDLTATRDHISFIRNNGTHKKKIFKQICNFFFFLNESLNSRSGKIEGPYVMVDVGRG